jgi:4-amino-4-deoxy-L-arabinose transferase-like glycosyltransferase
MWFRWTVIFLILFRVFLFYYFIVGEGTYIHPDSGAYIDLAENFLRNHVFAISTPTPDFQVQALDGPYGPEVFRTPGYPAFLILVSFLGMKNLLWAVFWQEIIYVLTVLMFYRYGRKLFSENITRAGVLFLLVDPGGIAYSKYILSETLFMPFLFASLLSFGLYYKYSNWRYLLVAGAAMGIGALIRPVILYFPWIAAATIVFFAWKNKSRWLHAGAMLLSFFLVISPWLIRNYQLSDQYFFSGQPSNMFANYHVPRIWNTKGIRNYWDGQKHIRKIVADARSIEEKQLGHPLNSVEFFKFQKRVAFTELQKYPKTYFTQWVSGSLKAMYVSFAIEIYNIYHAPGTNIPYLEIFPDTLGAEKTDFLGVPITETSGVIFKLIHYLIQVDKLYLFAVVSSVLTMLFAFLGVFYIFEKKDRFLWLMMLANFYFICVAGPMGYARFRVPVNGFWFVQACLGAIWFWGIFEQYLNKLKFRGRTDKNDRQEKMVKFTPDS